MGTFKFLLIAALVVIGAFAAQVRADDMDFGAAEPFAEPSAVTTGPAGPIAETQKAGNPTPAGQAAAQAAFDSSAVESSTLRTSRGSIWDGIKKNLGSSYFNYARIKANEANRGHGALDSYNYLSLEYRMSRQEKIFFRPAFLFNFGGSDLRDRNVPSKFEWADAYFGYSSYALPWLPFDMDYKTELRAYLPTSEISQKTGMIGRLRGDLKGYVPLTKRSTFLLWFKPDYYLQSRTGSLNDRGIPQGNKHYGYELSANYYYNATRAVGLGGAVGHEQYWTHAVPIENREVYRTEELFLSAFLGVSVNGFLVHLGAEQSRNIARPRDSFEFARDTELEYFARTNYRF